MTLPPLEILDSVPSTMDAARENILTGRVTFDSEELPNVGGVLANEQTAGRGQRGRVWYSEPGANLNATFYFRHGLTDPKHAGEIAILAGVAVLHALLILVSPLPSLSPKRVRFGLKWPNDVLLNEKKVGGILIEMIQAPDGEWIALIGVGLNLSIREFPTELQASATSLLREGISPPEAETLARTILQQLHAWAETHRNQGFSTIRSNWQMYNGMAGRRYEVEIEGETAVGVAEGISERGALLLRTVEGWVYTVTTVTSLREIG